MGRPVYNNTVKMTLLSTPSLSNTLNGFQCVDLCLLFRRSGLVKRRRCVWVSVKRIFPGECGNDKKFAI